MLMIRTMSQASPIQLSIRLLAVASLFLPWLLPAAAQTDQQPATQLTLTQIMAEPDWIGHPVEQAWWSTDGQEIFYHIQQHDGPLRELHAITLHDAEPQAVDRRLSLAQRSLINDSNAVYDRSLQRALYLRHGDVFMQTMDTGAVRQLTRTAGLERQPLFMTNSDQIMYQRDQHWWVHDLVSGLSYQAADLRSEDQPEDPEHGPLAEQQLRLFDTLRRQQNDQQAEQEFTEQLAQTYVSDADQPWYLGADRELVGSSLSPSGEWLLVITAEKDAEQGRSGKMPSYVTLSGYTDIEDVRTRVGQKMPGGHELLLLNLNSHELYPLSREVLPGIDEDPLASLRAAQELEPLSASRAAWVMDVSWHELGEQAAVQWRSVDNKDRWLTTVNFQQQRLEPRHRLHDDAWITWNFNEFGWLPHNSVDAEPILWFVSEQSGYAHLYTQTLQARQPTQHTDGQWEVYTPVISRSGDSVYFIANRAHPGEYELYQLQLEDDSLRTLTDLDGVESFTLAPDESHILVQYSGSYLPTQLALVNADQTRLLTDTRTDQFKAVNWQAPRIVPVNSQHDAGQPIQSKLYLPDLTQFSGPRPVVMFVHGAGYTQNTHLRYPYYFREQMFHNLLSQRGYIVLDMDFRASEGYGRDWRTAIYQQMGHPELEDLLDGLDWLSENYTIDRTRVGIYGGSYGGFMALMAMFRAPDQFQAGAALRPVTDWTAYNHGYTSNILNTPELDPEAYRKSSPIEYADGLQGKLLIAHGMLDDNVFYQDSVRLAQRLIELRKADWELASYPLEAHSFIYADSWYDEYRRILKLFENTIAD